MSVRRGCQWLVEELEQSSNFVKGKMKIGEDAARNPILIDVADALTSETFADAHEAEISATIGRALSALSDLNTKKLSDINNQDRVVREALANALCELNEAVAAK